MASRRTHDKRKNYVDLSDGEEETEGQTSKKMDGQLKLGMEESWRLKRTAIGFWHVIRNDWRRWFWWLSSSMERKVDKSFFFKGDV